MNETSSKTAPKQRKSPPGKPFVKGDPRINRKGRPPANSEELNALIDDIFAESLAGARGKQTTRIRDALERLLSHKNPIGTIHLLDRRFGKVSDKLDITSKGEALKGYTLVSPEDWPKKKE